MNGLLPIVEELAELETDAERALWLFSCPLNILDRENTSIRTLLRGAGFLAGVDYLDAEVSSMRAVRGPYGTETDQVRAVRTAAGAALLFAAKIPFALIDPRIVQRGC